MNSAIREAIDLLERAEDDIPQLSRDELESRVEDIRMAVDDLRSVSVDDLPAAISDVLDSLVMLYSDI